MDDPSKEKTPWGTAVTKPFVLEGDALQVNVDARSGRFHVEVLNAEGEPIPGFTAGDAEFYNHIDELRLKPRWKNNEDLSALRGRTIRLKFHLHDSQLYAFQIQ